MLGTFELAKGSVAGYDHVRAGKNNQDGYAVIQNEKHTVVVVCDGCSSGKHSEAGSQFGSVLLANIISGWLRTRDCWVVDKSKNAFEWARFRWMALWRMRDWADSMGALDREKDKFDPAFVNDYLLFTAVCAVVTPERTEFASLGDGCIAVNGEVSFMGPFENNAPPYLGYGLVPSTLPIEKQQFVVHKTMATSELQSFMVGSDGLTSLHRAESKPFPGKEREVGPMRQLWEDDKFFTNADAIRRHLVLVNGGVGSKLPGLLEDDTTLVIGRRSKNA